MIRATTGVDAPLTFHASVNGLGIYLDNFSLIRLAKHDRARRQRFVTALSHGADLIFSLANAAELTGPQGNSSNAVRDFLNEIGPHWFPVELDPYEVTRRELAGARPDQSCVSSDFMKQYFAARTANYTPGSGRIIDLSEQFFGLGAVLDWVNPQRASILARTSDLDEALIKKIAEYRTAYDRDPSWLEKAFPARRFVEGKPATFTYVNLVRTLILEAKSHRLKKGDGFDFCHAVIASSSASVATLDKHWKRRVESLPKPNKLARIYYEPQLDRMIDEIEAFLKSRSR